MKKVVVFCIVALVVSGCMGEKELLVTSPTPKENAMKEDALHRISQFSDTLKSIIIASLKKDPTGQNGLAVCSASAMKITDNFNGAIETNIKIRRTALKYRNPLNAPDDLDKRVMAQFLATKSDNGKMAKTSNGYRVYKPLYVAQPCLACHGSFKDMDPKIVAKIEQLYPKDLANGFKLGDFRGVIVADIGSN